MNLDEAKQFLLDLSTGPAPPELQPGAAEDALQLLGKVPAWAVDEYAPFDVTRTEDGTQVRLWWARSGFMFTPSQRFFSIETAGGGTFQVVEGEDDPDGNDEPIRRLALKDPDFEANLVRLLTWQTGGPAG